jgi:hypothetical protein
MDLVDQAQVLLRNGGYVTGPLGGVVHEGQEAITFEDDTVLGVLYRFADPPSLLNEWQSAQRVFLTRCASQLRLSRDKAWNVYVVFLTSSPAEATEMHALHRIEEDFAATRKIARAGITTIEDLHRGLLPLLPIRAVADFGVTDYTSKLRARLSALPAPAVDAILGSASPDEVARILTERP